ncbi:MAG TPA: M23 family metallopeptidase [Candidatus Dormibacteraeota bacterium]|nr:M23 family metallopeptidase [Candidatus Dormibacteraeota bacterium]
MASADTATGVAASPSAAPVSSPSPSPSSNPASSPVASASPTPTPSPSPSSKSQALQNKEAQAQLIGDLTSSEAHALMLEKALTDSQAGLVGVGQQILDSQRQLGQLDNRIAEVTRQHKEVSTRLQADRVKLTTVVRQLYKHQNNFFVSILRAGGFGGFLESVGYSDVVVDRERGLVSTVQADDVALAHSETNLRRTRSKQGEIAKSLELARSLLAQQIANEQSLQGQLQSTIDEALSALDASQSDTPAAAAQRARLIKMKTDSIVRQIEQAVWDQQNFVKTAQLIATDPVLSATGKLLMPIPHATITQGFGPTPYAFEAAYAGFAHFHTGVDLAVPLGTPVFAAADGVVVLARPMTDASGNLVGYGNYVILQHDTGLKTLYGHLLLIGVKEGDVVKRGQLIGLVGSTGNSTGPHTHFEVRIDNSPVDPMQLLPTPDPKAAPTAAPAPAAAS